MKVRESSQVHTNTVMSIPLNSSARMREEEDSIEEDSIYKEIYIYICVCKCGHISTILVYICIHHIYIYTHQFSNIYIRTHISTYKYIYMYEDTYPKV